MADNYELKGTYASEDVNFNTTDDTANGVPIGTTFTLSGAPGTMQILDDDDLLEDNNGTNNVVGGQSQDLTLQTLVSDFGDNAAGDYVWSRAYQDIVDSEGNVGRIYQIRSAPYDYSAGLVESGLTVPYNTYYSFSGDVNVGPGETYTTTGTFQGLANQSYSEFGTVTPVPCFTTGMLIETDRGEVRVEDLAIGDGVRTYDHGFQPIRFIKSRTVAVTAKNAPIVFKKGAIGNAEELIVSPMHRFHTGELPKDVLPKSLVRYDDNLIHAWRLMNGSTITRKRGIRTVTYWHFMFDQHELVYCHGTVSESWHPLRRNLKRDAETRRELFDLFPEISRKNIKNTPMVRQDIRQIAREEMRHAETYLQ